jgi:hypothetical protein
MGSVNLVVIVESGRALLKHNDKDLNKFHIPSVVAVGAALGGLPVLTHFIGANQPTRRRQVSSLSLLLLITFKVKPG